MLPWILLPSANDLNIFSLLVSCFLSLRVINSISYRHLRSNMLKIKHLGFQKKKICVSYSLLPKYSGQFQACRCSGHTSQKSASTSLFFAYPTSDLLNNLTVLISQHIRSLTSVQHFTFNCIETSLD